MLELFTLAMYSQLTAKPEDPLFWLKTEGTASRYWRLRSHMLRVLLRMSECTSPLAMHHALKCILTMYETRGVII